MKKHYVSYPNLSLISRKSLVSFRIKQELLLVYSYKFICVYNVSFYADITKIGTRFYHYRFTRSKPDKESHVAI